MVNMKELTKDPDWIKIRKQLLGKWNEDPEGCVRKLRKYLGNIETTDEKKLRIVMNYLTGSGFRTGKISHPFISELRGQISAELKRRKF